MEGDVLKHLLHRVGGGDLHDQTGELLLESFEQVVPSFVSLSHDLPQVIGLLDNSSLDVPVGYVPHGLVDDPCLWVCSPVLQPVNRSLLVTLDNNDQGGIDFEGA